MKLGVCWIFGAHVAVVLSSCTIPSTTHHELFCVRTSSSLGRTRYSFLRQTGANEPVLFYWSVWKDRRVEECSVSSDQGLVRDYRSLCGEDGTVNPNTTSLKVNVSVILEPGGQCRFGNFRTPRRDPDRRGSVRVGVKRRQKRAWIFPGTLWCGHGSSANEYEQLGMFERVDSCCREHDHCQHIIRPFTVNFGIFNPTLFTISHCDCDRRLKQCLLGINDTVSNMVGYSFFNILKLRCFDLAQKKRCTQINWLGTCTSVKVAPLAVIRNQAAYNVTSLDSGTTNPPGHLTEPSEHTNTTNEKPKPKKHSGWLKNVSPGRTEKTGSKTKTTSKTAGTKRTSELKVPVVMKSPQSSKSKPQKHTADTPNQSAEGYKRVMSKHKCASRESSKRPIRKGSKNETFMMCKITNASSVHQKVTKKHQASPSSSKKKQRPTVTASPVTVTVATSTRKSVKPRSGESRTFPRDPETNDGSISNTTERFRSDSARREKKKIDVSANENASVKEKPKPPRRVSDARKSTNTTSKSRTKLRNQNRHSSSEKTKTSRSSPWKGMRSVGFGAVCDVARLLDDCGYRIRPAQRAYGHHNTGSTTIYHCDCIQRLTDDIQEWENLGILKLVLKTVSTSCIRDIHPKGCRKSPRRCAASLSQAKTLKSMLMRTKEYRDTTKYREMTTNKRVPDQLYQHCLKFLRKSKKVKKNPSKHL